MRPPMKKRPSVRYHGKTVYVLETRCRAETDIILFTGDGQFARNGGGWIRIEPAVYEKIVPRSEVEFECEYPPGDGSPMEADGTTSFICLRESDGVTPKNVTINAVTASDWNLIVDPTDPDRVIWWPTGEPLP